MTPRTDSAEEASWLTSVDWPDFARQLERQLSAMTAEKEKWRGKAIERKRQLREANKGCERNALALQLSIHRQMKSHNDREAAQIKGSKHRDALIKISRLAVEGISRTQDQISEICQEALT